MRCSNCQHEVPDGYAFCPVCQSPVSQGLPMACPNCGYPPANPNSTICPYCHSPLPSGQQPAQSDLWGGSQPAWESDGRIDIFGDGWQEPVQEQPVFEPEQPIQEQPVFEPEQPVREQPVFEPEQPQQPASVPAWQQELEEQNKPFWLADSGNSEVSDTSDDSNASDDSNIADNSDIVSDTPEPPTEPAAAAPAFELRPMLSPLMPAAMQGIAFQGDSVVLNGQNLSGPMMDPECQAVVARDADGNWTIANGSQNQSTYMLVNRPMALRDGDVIILGGNLYVFHPNEQQ